MTAGLAIAAAWHLGAGGPGPAPYAAAPTSLAARSEVATVLPPSIETVSPRAGGLPRTIVQTGSIEPFESADLYPRVSGYLRTVAVEIGEDVQAGQVLAEIEAPELAGDVDSALARLEHARAQLQQADARLAATQASRQAAAAVVGQAEADIPRAIAERSLREKEYARVEFLSRQGVIEAKLLDERLHQTEAAQAGEEWSRAAALVAQAELAAAAAQVEQARADRGTAEAAVRVAAAELERARVLLDFTRIRSPYRGVVTQRNYDHGAFVRSADRGGDRPLFTVVRTDTMRVVLQVPDRYVPFINPHDPADVRVESLAGETFAGRVARISRAQDPRTRTMRAEIDLPNDSGRLRAGMYGAVRILVPAPRRGMTVPAAALIGAGPHNSRGSLRIHRNGRIQVQPVGIGVTEGAVVEILWGLEPDDAIVLHAPASVLDQALVAAEASDPQSQALSPPAPGTFETATLLP